ncbi:hypothetical protein NBRC116493_25100 [Aurantivibrio infirmus]
MKIYFVRHGLVNYDTQQLSSEGKEFAAKLAILIREDVDYIACDKEQRCKDTIQSFSIRKGIRPNYFDKSEFTTKKPLAACPEQGVSVICYRIEAVNHLFAELNIPLFTDLNRDTAYEKIIVLELDGAKRTLSHINTGYRKL